jgi:hypothetical protein
MEYICVVKILAFILLIIFSVHLVRPLSRLVAIDNKMECCSDKACDKPVHKNSKEDCNTNACDMLSCIVVNYFLPSTGLSVHNDDFRSGEKLYCYNDNRLSFISSGCWHPPEI